MPNFNIPEMVRYHISYRADTLMHRPLELALGAFPLSVEQVQRAILSDEQVATMQCLVDQGVQTIAKHDTLRLALLRHDNLPGLNRSAVVQLGLPTNIFVGRATMYSIPSTKFDMSEKHYLIPDFSRLSDAERHELVLWVERCVRQRRLNEVTAYCVHQVIFQYSPTTSHLHALWPELASVVDPPSAGYGHVDYLKTWVEKLRNPARRNVASYRQPEVKARLGKMLEVANMQIATGLLLKDYKYRKDQIRAVIEHWERLDRDLRLP